MQQDLLYKTSYRLNPTPLTGAVLAVNTSWDYYFVSGGTTIVGLANVGVGMQVLLDFETATTLTHSTNLILPSNIDIEAVPGDVYAFAQVSATAWKNISGGGHSGGGSIDNTPYGPSWEGVETVGASKDALYDKIETLAKSGRNSDISRMNGINGVLIVGGSSTGGSVNFADSSVFIGPYAGMETHDVAFGMSNTGVGHSALSSNTIGIRNCALGTNAGNILNGGDKNTFIGTDSASHSSLGNNNTFVGYASGSTVEGDSNVIVGYNSGISTNNQLDNNVLVGSNILLNGTTSKGIFIGDGAKGVNGTTENEIVVGYGAQGEGSNTTTIGKTSTTDIHLHGIVHPEDGMIEFPSLNFPSSNPNTLDDYEEGTFTPIFTASTTDFTYASQYGVYTKIGDMVTFGINIVLTSLGTSAGTIQLEGLPFIAKSNNMFIPSTLYWEQMNFGEVPMSYISPGQSHVRVGRMVSDSATVRYDVTDMEATTRLRMQGSYFTS